MSSDDGYYEDEGYGLDLPQHVWGGSWTRYSRGFAPAHAAPRPRRFRPRRAQILVMLTMLGSLAAGAGLQALHA